jgi:hypothetical protein
MQSKAFSACVTIIRAVPQRVGCQLTSLEFEFKFEFKFEFFCVQLSAEVITMAAFSSYVDVSTMKCPGAASSPLRPSVTNEALRRVNWLLNNFYNPQQNLPTMCTVPDNVNIPVDIYQNTEQTGPGTYGPITKEDMQAAVWTLTGKQSV